MKEMSCSHGGPRCSTSELMIQSNQLAASPIIAQVTAVLQLTRAKLVKMSHLLRVSSIQESYSFTRTVVEMLWLKSSHPKLLNAACLNTLSSFRLAKSKMSQESISVAQTHQTLPQFPLQSLSFAKLQENCVTMNWNQF